MTFYELLIRAIFVAAFGVILYGLTVYDREGVE